MVIWSIPESMWSKPWHNYVNFFNAVRDQRSWAVTVSLGLAACVQQFLQILWSCWWYDGLQMTKSLNPLQLHIALKLVDYLHAVLFTKWWTPAQPCFSTGMLLLYPIKTLTSFQLTCSTAECLKQMILVHSSTFPVFYCPIGKKQQDWLIWTLNVFVVYSIEYRLKGI